MRPSNRKLRVVTLAAIATIVFSTVSLTASYGASAAHHTTSPRTARPAATNHRLAFLLGVQNNPFYQTEECWANIAAKQQGYTVTFQGPASFDVNLEDQVTLALAATRPAGLVVDPVFGNEQAPTIKQVISNHVPVATVEEPISVPGQVINITAEHQILGRMAADAMAKLLHGKGQVFISDYQKGVQSTDARAQGFEQELKKYPGLKIVGQSWTASDLTAASQQMASFMISHPNLKGIFGTNLYSIEGDLNALKADGKLSQLKIISTDALPVEIPWLRSGEVQELIAQKPGVIAALAIDTLISYLKGNRPAENKTFYVKPPFVAITKANMNAKSVSQYFATGDCSVVRPGTVKALLGHLPPK
jgi:ribose transport system substrate-binding protein